MPPAETLKQIVIFGRFEDQWDCKWTPAVPSHSRWSSKWHSRWASGSEIAGKKKRKNIIVNNEALCCGSPRHEAFFIPWRLALNEKTPLFLPPLIRKKRKRREKISFRERQMPPPETLKQIVIFRRFEDQWDCKWTPAMRNKKESCLHPKATLFIYLQLGGSLLRWGRSVHLYSAGLGVWTWIDLKNRLLWFFVSQQ